MRVDWAIPCRYAEVQPGGATIVGAGTDLHWVPELPAVLHVLFAVRFSGAPDELDGSESHTVSMTIYNPNGNRISEQTMELATEVKQIVPGYVADVTIPARAHLEVATYGTFSVAFGIDGGEPLRVPIHIIEPEQP